MLKYLFPRDFEYQFSTSFLSLFSLVVYCCNTCFQRGGNRLLWKNLRLFDSRFKDLEWSYLTFFQIFLLSFFMRNNWAWWECVDNSFFLCFLLLGGWSSTIFLFCEGSYFSVQKLHIETNLFTLGICIWTIMSFCKLLIHWLNLCH